MSRLELVTPDRAKIVLEGLYKDLERRIESSPPGLCPVDMARAFLDLSHAQTCGKCTPCRVGLGQIGKLMTDVLEGRATMATLETMEKTAKSIMHTADCAIGYEAANMVHKGLIGYREDYIGHIEYGRCVCSYSQPVPCVSRCPAKVDIPGYIALVGEKRYEDAVKLIRKDNPFPTTCAFICEHPCEVHCRRNMVDDSINIRGIKRVATDFAGQVEPPKCAESTGKKIAVAGGGPAGLSAAFYLQLMGHQVTVYEMLSDLGGMLRYGIPNYRLPKDKLEEDINAILKTGIEVKLNKKIGEDYSLQDLRKKYDAVFITIGASIDLKLGIPGEKTKGVISAVDFLRDVGLNTPMDLNGKEVVVIGGGNVSMDAVRTAKRLGAEKVSIVYRRRVADMTALPAEIEGAIAEGIEMQKMRAPKEIISNDEGSIKGLYVTPQMISEIKDGRATIKDTGEADEFIPCDLLIVAAGQDIEVAHFEEAGITTKRGRIVTNPDSTIEGMPGVFAGGDCSSGPATVISAIAAAKVIAANIDEYLGYHHDITSDVEVPLPNLSDRNPCGRVDMIERESEERIKDFDGVELCMSEAEAMQESSRCLRCDHFGFGIFKGGREKLW